MTKKELIEALEDLAHCPPTLDRGECIGYVDAIDNFVDMLTELEPTISEVKEWCIKFQDKNKHPKNPCNKCKLEDYRGFKAICDFQYPCSWEIDRIRNIIKE